MGKKTRPNGSLPASTTKVKVRAANSQTQGMDEDALSERESSRDIIDKHVQCNLNNALSDYKDFAEDLSQMEKQLKRRGEAMLYWCLSASSQTVAVPDPASPLD